MQIGLFSTPLCCSPSPYNVAVPLLDSLQNQKNDHSTPTT